MKGRAILFFLLWTVFNAISWGAGTASAVNVSACTTLGSANTYYTMNQSVSSSGTCFTITEQNVTLDCMGHTITYSTGGGADTVGIYTDQANTTIKNCNVVDGNWASGQASRHGIHGSSMIDSTIFNNTVNASNSYAILLEYNSNSNNISSSSLFSNSSYAVRFTNAMNNVVEYSTITSAHSHGFDGGTVRNETFRGNNVTGTNGFVFLDAINVTLADNTATGTESLGHGLYFGGSASRMTNNTFRGTGTTQSHAISMAFAGTENNTLTSNTATAVGGSGISLYSSVRHNVFVNNTAISYYEYDHGVSVSTGSNNNTFTGNSIHGYNGASGLYVYQSSNNTFTESNVTGLGAYRLEASYNNTVYDCVHTYGSTYDVRVESVAGSTWNSFINCSYDMAKESVTGTNNYILRRWYFDANVTDAAGIPVEAANVTVYNYSSTIMDSQLTDASGNIGREVLTSYMNRNGVRTYHTPHTVNTSKAGYVSNSTSYNLSALGNIFLSIRLETPSITVALADPHDGAVKHVSHVNFSCLASANTELTNVTLYIWGSGGAYNVSTSSASGAAALRYWTVEMEDSGTYSWNCKACDASVCAFGPGNYTLTMLYESRLSLRLFLNGTSSSVYVPGSGEYDSSLVGIADYSPPHFYVVSYDEGAFSSLVFSGYAPRLITAGNGSDAHYIGLEQYLSGSRVFLAFSRGDWSPVDARMDAIETGRFMQEISPSFSYGLGNRNELGLALSYSAIDLQGSLRLGRGTHRITVENNGTFGGRPSVLLEIS